MKTFEYKGYDHDGRPRKGLIEAVTPKGAREELAAAGVFAQQLLPAGEKGSVFRRGVKPRLSVEDRALLYQELGALLGAGLTVVQALDVLVQSPEMGRIRPLLAGVRDRIKEGAGLSTALAAVSRSIRAYETASIGAGERTGALGEVLEDLAGFLESEQAATSRVVTALIYPSLVVLFALLVAVVLLGFVVPSIESLLVQGGQAIPGLTRAMLELGTAIRWGGFPTLVVAVAVCVWFNRRRRADAAFRERVDRALYGVPGLGTGYRLLSNLRFSHTLALLLRGGVSIVDAVPLAGRATGSVWVERLCSERAESVRHGRSLADALRGVPPLAALLPGWVQVGEASGSLAVFLGRAADRYQRQWDRFMARGMALLEPALIVVVGGFVLLVTLSVLLPILAMNNVLM